MHFKEFGVVCTLALLMLGSVSADRYNVQTHAIHIKEPKAIAGDYEAAIGDFGVPLYGGILSGELVIPRYNENACKRFDDSSLFASSSKNLPKIALVDRGGCFFIEKAFHAQQAGASAVIVVDDRSEPLITMSTPQEEPSVLALMKEIEIPSALVKKSLGDHLKEAMVSGKKVIVELNWRESILNPDSRVEWELWTTSNDACGASCEEQARFKMHAAEVAMEMEQQGFTEFTPRYKFRKCEREEGEDCSHNCIHNGRYCSIGHISYPFNESYSTFDVVLENKRQICLFDELSKIKKQYLWWKYVSSYAKHCKIEDGTFGSDCARRQLRKLQVPKQEDFVRKVDKCMGDTNSDEPQPLLEEHISAESKRVEEGHGHVTYLPTLMINTVQYRGRLEMGSVLRAVCAGFKESSEPGVCLQKGMQVNECESDNACWKNPNSSLSEHSSSCLDTFRGHICMCPKGYIGDGYTCEDMNECTLGISGCSQKCINTVGGYKCACEDGFMKVGETQCVLADVCLKDNGQCQHHCQSTAHGAVCSCRDGYNLNDDGKTCSDIDECKLGEHECDQVCINTNPRHSGGYKYVCGCHDGYSLDINDPTLHKCVKNDELLKSWGIDSEGKSNNALTILEIALIVVVSVAVVTSLGYVYYRWRLKLLWDKEIRSILGQYVPLDDKAPATDNKKLNQSANATFQEEKNQK